MVEAFACAGDVPGEGDRGVGGVEGGGEFAAGVERHVAVFGDGVGVSCGCGFGVVGGLETGEGR